MKSPMVTNLSLIDDKANYSDLRVLSSAVGWYIGTLHKNELGFVEPGTRDSPGYYATMEEAEAQLAALSVMSWEEVCKALRKSP